MAPAIFVERAVVRLCKLRRARQDVMRKQQITGAEEDRRNDHRVMSQTQRPIQLVRGIRQRARQIGGFNRKPSQRSQNFKRGRLVTEAR
jgi:hypothetical protein